MHSKLLVDSENFIPDLKDTLKGAKRSIQVQTMTFEGDGAGKWLINAMVGSKAESKRLLIDSYSKAVINDHFIWGVEYLKSNSFRKEVKETKRLIEYAISQGIEVKFTNPLGFLMHKYPLRNHKKMIIVDDEVAYIGGINFSEHNFEWHDAMIRLSGKAIGKALSADFDATWTGVNQSGKIVLGEQAIYFMNGSKSKKEYEDLFAVLGGAQKSIDIFSPYVSDPLLSYLKDGLKNKVQIRIVSPGENNKSIFKKHLNNELLKGYFELLNYQKGMSHLKAILLDKETLIMGSSNFDFVSYHFEQEVILVSKDQGLVADFKEKVSSVDLTFCNQVNPNEIIKSNAISYLMHLLNWVTDKASVSLLKTK